MAPVRCAQCGEHISSPSARFCSACGSALQQLADDPRSAMLRIVEDPELSGEHKFVTVVFSDIKGSTEAAGIADPEEWFAALERFHIVAVEAVANHGGVVTSYAGDGVMAMFGAPIAHEHHAEQACRAALQLVDEVDVLADELETTLGSRLRVRVGINSGRVVVGRVGEAPRIDYTAQGVPVHLAARMEQMAPPGQILVGAGTAQLVDDRYELVDFGEHTVKGIDDPVRVHRLVGIRTVTTDSSAEPVGAPLVGRGRELAFLRDALSCARPSTPFVTIVSAPGGTGKSHLMRAFLAEVASANTVVTVVGDTVASPEPLWGVRRLVAGLLGVELRADDAGVAAACANLGLSSASVGIAQSVIGANAVAPGADPSITRRLIDEALSELVRCRARSASGALVIAIDDMHGIDEVSRRAVSLISTVDTGSPVLLLLTTRPTADPIDLDSIADRSITLEPLDPAATAELVRLRLGVADGARVDAFVELVVERSGGNPFFVEETIRALAETGHVVREGVRIRLAAPIDDLRIPAGIETVVAARIDRLSRPARDLLLAAAAIGLEADIGLLASSAGLDDVATEVLVDELVAADLVHRTPDRGVAFRHRIIQEVTYSTQLRDRRRRVHAAIAHALEQQPEGRGRAAELARHHRLGGDNERSMPWYEAAARSAALTDPAEARRLLEELRQLTPVAAPDLADAGLRARHELLLQGARSGIDGEEVAQIVAEIRSMAIGEQHAVALAIGLLRAWTAYSSAGWNAEARAISREAVAAADATGIDVVSVGARLSEISNSNASGSVPHALSLCDEADALLVRSGFDGPDSALRSQLEFARGSLLVRAGRADEAIPLLESSIATSDRLDDSMWRVLGRAGIVVALIESGEAERAVRLAAEAVELARESCGVGEQRMASFALGRACLAAGRHGQGLEALREAVADSRAAGTHTSEEAMLAELADAYRLAGELAAAEASAQEAVDLARLRGNDTFEIMALLALARVRLAQDADPVEIEAPLSSAEALIEKNGVAMLQGPADAIRAAFVTSP